MLNLIDIDEGNWRTPLAVSQEQTGFVANTTTILARAYAYREYRSRAFLVCREDTPVGIGMYHDSPELEAYIFSELFIDRRYQGRGYGKHATELILNDLRQDGKYRKVVLCYIQGNIAAKHMYESFGFTETDRDEDEIMMELEWSQCQ